MPSSEDSGSSSPWLDLSIIHEIRPGLFDPPRNSIIPPRPHRIRRYRSVRRDGREYTKAEEQYFILELHQRLLRVLDEQYATGEAPPRYIQLLRTPYDWSHYLNKPHDDRSEGMGLDEMDKKDEEKLLQIEVRALLELCDTDPNRFYDTVIEMNEAAREQMEEVRPIERPSAQVIEMIRNNTAAGLDPSRTTRPTTDHIPRKPAGEGNQLGPTTKSRLLPDPKPWIPFGKQTADDRAIENAAETRPAQNLRTDLFDRSSKRTEFTSEEIQALNANINRIRVIMAARLELELGNQRGNDTGSEVPKPIGVQPDAPGLAGAWTSRHRDQDQDQDWRMQIVNQLCESGSTSSALPTAGDRNDPRPSIGTRMPQFPYQMNPAQDNAHIEAWRARRDDFGGIGIERAAKRSRPASLLRRH